MPPSENGGPILVIGGAGYVGSLLTRRLLREGYRVRVLDAMRFGQEPLEEVARDPRLETRTGDIRDLREVTRALEGVAGVVLLAALVGGPACDRDPRETVEINWLATKMVAEACRYQGIPRFVYASTDSVYGVQEGVLTETSPMNPISLYARLKRDMEQEILALRDDRFHPCVLRMATIYGLSPRMRFDLILNVLVRDAVLRRRITIHGGQQWRPLVHVADAAEAYVLSLRAPLDAVSGEIFNVGSNEQNYLIGQLGELVREQIPDIEVITVPQTPDLRDYHVCFDKISGRLGYRVQRTPAEGIKDIQAALQDGALGDPFHRRYYNA